MLHLAKQAERQPAAGLKVLYRMQHAPLRFLLILLSLASTLPSHAADYFPPPDTQGGWRTLNDPAEIRAKAGMDAQRLDWAADFTQRCTQNGGLLVVRHGYLVCERYFGRAH